MFVSNFKASDEEAVKALVHEVVQSGSGVGGFQKVVDGSQDVLVLSLIHI